MSGDDGLRVMGPCTECHAPHQDCAAPAYCCDECLHLAEDWEGYELAPPTSVRLIALPADELAALRAKADAADRVREGIEVLSRHRGLLIADDLWAALADLQRTLDGPPC